MLFYGLAIFFGGVVLGVVLAFLLGMWLTRNQYTGPDRALTEDEIRRLTEMAIEVLNEKRNDATPPTP